MKKPKPTFESSLKSIEIENFFDRTFYRPLGYRIALWLTPTGITPNMVTIVSIFFGVGAGFLFYPQNIWINLLGFFILMIANTLDCADGQLARLTGIKSAVGRILDGVAGDLWFISIYICIAFRLSAEIGTSLAWVLASLAGASTLIQANISDYYKTAHLYFTSLSKGAEFDTVEKTKAKYAQTPNGINKVLCWLYVYYTILQTKTAPQLQNLIGKLIGKYGEDFPEEVRLRLRKKSLEVMPYINITTFNWRSVGLLFSILIQQIWVYLLFEIIVLNVIIFIAIRKHAKFCREFEV